MNVEITKEVEFDAGHRVPSHEGKCRNPHGHRYRVRVRCAGPIQESGPAAGMLVDFSDLKQILAEVVEPWDHAFLVHVEDSELMHALAGHGWRITLMIWVPTAENIARIVFSQMQGRIEDRFGTDLRLVEAAVWETPTSVAYCREDA